MIVEAENEDEKKEKLSILPFVKNNYLDIDILKLNHIEIIISNYVL